MLCSIAPISDVSHFSTCALAVAMHVSPSKDGADLDESIVDCFYRSVWHLSHLHVNKYLEVLIFKI